MLSFILTFLQVIQLWSQLFFPFLQLIVAIYLIAHYLFVFCIGIEDDFVICFDFAQLNLVSLHLSWIKIFCVIFGDDFLFFLLDGLLQLLNDLPVLLMHQCELTIMSLDALILLCEIVNNSWKLLKL